MVDIKIYGRYSTDNGATYLSELVWSKEMQYNDQTIYDEVIFEQSLNSAGKLDLSMREYSPFFTNFAEEKYSYLEIFFDNKIFWRGLPYEYSISADYEGGKRLIQKIDVSYQGLLSLIEQHNINSLTSLEDTGLSEGDTVAFLLSSSAKWTDAFNEFNGTTTSPLEKIFFDSMEILVDNSSDSTLRFFHLPESEPMFFYRQTIESIKAFGDTVSPDSVSSGVIRSGSMSVYIPDDGYTDLHSYSYDTKRTITTSYNYSAKFPESSSSLLDTFFNGFLSSGNELSFLQVISDFHEIFGGNLYQSIVNDQMHLKLIEEKFVPIQDLNISSNSIISFEKSRNVDRIYKTINGYELQATQDVTGEYTVTDRSFVARGWNRHMELSSGGYTGTGVLMSAENVHERVYRTLNRYRNIVKSKSTQNSDTNSTKEKHIFFCFFNSYNDTYNLTDTQRQHVVDLYADWDLNHRYTIKIEAFDRGFVEDQPIIDMNKRIPVTLPEIGLDKVPGLVTAVHYEFLAPENNRVSIEIGTKDASYLYSPLTKARIMNAKEDGNG